jgi:uncharacterized protein with HEPN domain
MRDYARKAIAIVQGQHREDLDNDEKLCFALTHVVELIGEAASQVPPEVQGQYPEIPWSKVISMRNRLPEPIPLPYYKYLTAFYRGE